MNTIRTFALIVLLSLLSDCCIAQDQGSNYFRLWKKVHHYELEDLPKSAAVLVDSIYALARQEDNEVQSLKALVYQSKFISLLEEDAPVKVMKGIEQEMVNAGAE
ncbi:MAG: hypothetical protein AAGA66_01215 [Bacteroidota bacterium]